MQKDSNDKRHQSQILRNDTDIPFLKNIALMQTFKCTIACQHCIMEAGPHRHEEMAYEDSVAWIDQAKKYRDGYIQGLALTGGEPFYNLELLRRVSTYGSESGFLVSAVTNASWATSMDHAVSVLQGLPSVRLLCISTDQFHKKFIPFEYVRNAAMAADQSQIIYSFAVCTPNLRDPQYLRIMDELAEITAGESKVRISLTFPVGRAEVRSQQYNYHITAEPPVGACQMACSPVIFPDGKVMGCIGPVLKLHTDHPLVLGDLKESSLAEILDRSESNTILHMIRVWGPHKVLELLQERYPDVALPREFIANCNCDVCYRLFKNENVVELLKEIHNKDTDLREEIAYGRQFYLNETRMLETLALRD